MQHFLEFILIASAFLSIIPVINMFRNRNDQKYVCLKVLIYSTFFWSILIIFERLSTSTIFIYYAGMLGFSLRFLFASLMLCTIYQYVGKRFPKGLEIILGIFFLADLIIALTNPLTQWFLELKPNELATFNDLYQSNYGPLFVYHLVLSYMVALSAIVLLFVFLYKKKGVRQYKEVTRMMSISVICVLFFNAIQLFVVKINVNLTYISLVIVAYALYDVIYRKDMVFNLRSSGRSEILANMRELYILTDSHQKIIEISPLLLEKYGLNIDEVIGEDFQSVVVKLKQKVTLYTDYDMNEEPYEDKDHYHLREKDFKLKGMNESGHMILLYDETQIYKLLRELNTLSNYDSMTGLKNRNYIENKLKELTHPKHIGILSIDLNGLKINNDYLGHERGDFLLRSIADRMRSVFNDINHKDMARIGGDEFIILLYDVDQEIVESKKNELLKACDHQEIDQMISISIGTSYHEDQDISIFTLIKQADQKMYMMKEKTSPIYREKMIEFIKKQDQYIR